MAHFFGSKIVLCRATDRANYGPWKDLSLVQGHRELESDNA
jgi:hypothetical protein